MPFRLTVKVEVEVGIQVACRVQNDGRQDGSSGAGNAAVDRSYRDVAGPENRREVEVSHGEHRAGNENRGQETKRRSMGPCM